MKLFVKPGARVRLLSTAVARPIDLAPQGEHGLVLDNEAVMALVHGVNWREVMAEKAAARGAAPAMPLPQVACRQWLTKGAHALHLAEEAARRALQAANLRAADLAGLICVTSTPPIVSASMAARVGKAIGLGVDLNQAACFDVRAGGVGVMQAWFAAQGLIVQGSGPVLIVAAEASSQFMSPGDLASALLYADGAGACVLGPGHANDADTFLGGLGGQMSLPGQPTTIPGTLPPHGDLNAYRFQRPDRTHLEALLALWAQFPQELARAFPEANARLRHFLPYAVTQRQMDVACEALAAPQATLFHELQQWGCVGAASPLTALHGLLQSGRAQPGDVLLLASAAGNGLWSGFYWRL